MFEVNAGQDKQRTRGACAFADEASRSGDSFRGVVVNDAGGCMVRPRGKREVTAFHLENTRTSFKPRDAGRRSDPRTGGSAASAPTGTTACAQAVSAWCHDITPSCRGEKNRTS